MKIGVTGTGGEVGQGILKSLQDTDYEVVAIDGEYLAAGLYATKTSYIVPYANKDNYIPELLEICKKEKISLLFPGMDAELMPMAKNKHLFEEIGTTVVVSSPEVVTISDDKFQTFEQLIKAGINVPKTYLAQKFKPNESDFPIILKQKVGGARSVNIHVVKNIREWQSTLEIIGENLSDYIAMDYIEGEEYTCGTINLDGNCKGVIVMRRTLRGGATHKCFSIKNDLIENEVRRLVNSVKPFGACNVQLRLKDNVPYVFEINARCSGTTGARTLCGFNEPKMIADYLLKGIEPSYEIIEQTIMRYSQEMVADNKDVEELKEKRVLKKEINHKRI